MLNVLDNARTQFVQIVARGHMPNMSSLIIFGWENVVLSQQRIEYIGLEWEF
jgi:hypothetical protein